MAVFFIGGTDFYTSTSGIQGYFNDIFFGSQVSLTTSPPIPPGYGSTSAWSFPYSGYLRIPIPVPGTGPFIAGFRVYIPTLAGGAGQFFTLRDETLLEQMYLRLEPTGAISAYAPSPDLLLGTTALGLIAGGTWNYVEVKATCSGASGTVAIHFNGVSVLSLSGVRTQDSSHFGGTGHFAFIDMGGLGLSNGNGAMYQDIYAADTTTGTGILITDFIGDVTVTTERPVGTGTYNDYTPNGDTPNWKCVDDILPDDDATYSSDATANHKFSVTVSTDPFDTIFAVQHVSRIKKDRTGATRQVQQLVRSAATDAIDPTVITLGTTYRYYSQILEVDPATGVAWVQSGVNALEIGLKTTT